MKEKIRRRFMEPDELKYLRTRVIKFTQDELTTELINPVSGNQCCDTLVSAWECNRKNIPLWAARRIRELAEAATKVIE